MNSLESVISFLVLVSFSLFLFTLTDEKIDNSLYLYELQSDAKNIIQLNGGFENITKGNEIAKEILDKSGLCIELSETDLASKIVSKGISSFVLIPKLDNLYISFNDSELELKRTNLSGFTKNNFLFGNCKLE